MLAIWSRTCSFCSRDTGFITSCQNWLICSNLISRSVVSNSVTQWNRSTPGFPVHRQLPQLAQTHVHQVGDAIQPSHPLSSPSLAFSLSQHQGLFQWVSSSHQVGSFSLSISPSSEYSGLTLFRIDWLISLQTKGLSRIFPNTTVQKYQTL